MYLTRFEYKKVKNKNQWVCANSYKIADIDNYKSMKASNGVIALGMLKMVYAFTANKVNLGSCKRPHTYIWSKSC
jgi:hypothetical protein